MDEETNKQTDNNYLVLGLDDAGRGPVIGPMVLAGCLASTESEKEFRGLGIMDSKLLTAKKRENLDNIIKEKVIAHHIHTITPIEIDTGMGTGLNLNEVEALAAGIIINNLLEKIGKKDKKVEIFIDCPSVNTVSWKKCLEKYVDDKDANIVCSHKADVKYPIVSAASIIAKVHRDSEIEKLKKQIGIDFGSGYPADPKTKKFLEENHSNPEYIKKHIFRESWSTYQNAVKAKTQTKLPDY